MLRIIYTCILGLFFQLSFAQSYSVKGIVTDSVSGLPMEYTTVSLFEKETNSLVTGGITSLDGDFQIKKVKKGTYYAKITFVGYENKIISGIEINKSSVDLGTIKLSSSLNLKAVVVKGIVPTTTFEIDKKVIDVENFSTSVGQTAVEVLENTPSVQVDNDGNVTLRGSSGFTLLINGRPTAMDANDALQSIPASTIKNIEIVTNPSAREQAEGSGGIINIITKRNKLEGVSLLANGNAGRFEQYGGDAVLNYKVNRHTLILTGAYNNRTRRSNRFQSRVTDIEDASLRIDQLGVGSWDTDVYRAGIEWLFDIDTNHSLSIGTNLARRNMNPFENSTFFEYENDSLLSTTLTREFSNIFVRSMSSFANYSIRLKDQKSKLDFRSVYNLRYVDEYVTANYFDLANNQIGGTYNTEFGPSAVLRFNIDFVKHIKNDFYYETGVQAQFGNSKDDRDNFRFNEVTRVNERIPEQSTDVNYLRNVYGAYGLFRGKTKKLGYQVGLRAEYTNRSIDATNFTETFGAVNRLDFFPSAHFSYKLPKDQQLLFSVSRRIERPVSYYFEPFITVVSDFSVRKGNPDLKPEYINTAEVSWIKQLGNKGSVSVEGYTKYLVNSINRINSVFDTNVIIQIPQNIGTSLSVGFEPNVSYYLFDWWNTNLAANGYFFRINSAIEGSEGIRESYNWNARLRNTFTLDKTVRFQFLAKYRSKTVTAVGEQEANYGFDASIRKTFWKNKLSLNLQVNDIFNTSRRIYRSELGNVTIYSERNPYSPRINLTVSLKLNNYKSVASKKQQLDSF